MSKTETQQKNFYKKIDTLLKEYDLTNEDLGCEIITASQNNHMHTEETYFNFFVNMSAFPVYEKKFKKTSQEKKYILSLRHVEPKQAFRLGVQEPVPFEDFNEFAKTVANENEVATTAIKKGGHELTQKNVARWIIIKQLDENLEEELITKIAVSETPLDIICYMLSFPNEFGSDEIASTINNSPSFLRQIISLVEELEE